MYERSLSIQRNATAYSNLGTAYYQQGMYADAARAFEGAVELPGATVEHWRNLAAACYWAPGLRGRAREAYEQAVALGEQARAVNPRDAATLVSLASSYAVLGTFTGDPQAGAHAAKARTIALGLERQPPQSADHLSVIAGVWEALGDREQALDWLTRAVTAGYDIDRVDRSPYFSELRKDARYAGIRRR
jgi:tetratricopeptide (TPR) repeat protein